MADDNVVAVRVTADVASYTDAMRQAAAVTGSSMEAVKAAATSGAQGASQAIEGLKAQLATLQASYSAQGREVTGLKESLETLKEELSGVRQPAEEAGGAVKSLGDRLKEKVSEQRSEGRLGAFIAKDLALVMPASSEATGAVAGLVSGFAFGGGMGLAIEGVKLLVEAIAHAGEESKRLAEQAEATAKKWREQTDAIIAGIKGQAEAQKVFHDQVATSASSEFDLKQKLLDANATLSKSEADLADAKANHSAAAQVVFGQEVDHARAVVESLERQLAVQKELTKTATANVAQVNTAEQDKAAEASLLAVLDAAAKEGAERESVQRAVDAKLAALHAQTLDGNEKLEAEYVANIAAIDQQGNLTAVQAEAEKTATLEAYRKQLTDFAAAQQVLEVERQKQAIADLKSLAEQIAAPLRELMPAIDKQTNDAIENQKRLARAALQADEQRVRSSLGAAKQMGDAFGASVAGIITGSESATKALASMAAAGVKAFLDMEIQAIEADAVARTRAIATAATTVTSNAASAASGAAASQAGIPIIGPGLAIAAMAAMEAAVLGLLSALPSAAGGWGDVPHDLTANIHKGEQVWPAQYAEGGRQLLSMLADGEGMGGGDVHLHVHTASVREFVAYLGQSEVQRGISQLVRTGRWAG